MFIKRGRSLSAVLIALSSSLVLGACGAAERPAAAGSGTVNAAFTTQVQKTVDTATAPQPALKLAQNPAVDGKKVAIVSVTLAETGALRISKALTAAVEDIGWTSTTYDGQGSPTTANQKLEQAVTTNPDAIVLIALDPTDVGSGLLAAKAAGIPVSCAACWNLKAPDEKGDVYADVTPPLSTFQQLGYLTAAYSYLRAQGRPHFLRMNDPALSNLSARETGFTRFMDECTSAGGDCTVVAKKDFQVANATTTLPADGASLARANPDFNAFWVSYDFAGLQVLNGLRQAGLATSTTQFMVASNGDGANIDLVKSDGYIKATVAVSFEQLSYALVDNLNRIVAGQPTTDENVPVRLFDKDNADQAQNGAWGGDVDYRAAYRAAWGR